MRKTGRSAGSGYCAQEGFYPDPPTSYCVLRTNHKDLRISKDTKAQQANSVEAGHTRGHDSGTTNEARQNEAETASQTTEYG